MEKKFTEILESAIWRSYNQKMMRDAKNMYLVKIGETIFPLGPSNFSVNMNDANTFVTLINKGEVVVPGPEKLKTIEMELVIPGQPYPFAFYPASRDGTRGYKTGEYRPPEYYINILQDLKQIKKPFSIHMVRAFGGHNLGRNFSHKVVLGDVTFSEEPDLGADVKATLSFVVWRNYGTKKVKFKQSANSTKVEIIQNRPPSSRKRRTYTVRKGDSLRGIAKKKLGRASRWKDIYLLNKKAIRRAARKEGKPGNGTWIKIGMKLRLPKE